MARALLLLALICIGMTAKADCLRCPDEVVDLAVAHEGLERVLEAPLPEGTEVLHFVEGGFQDKFWQFSLSVPTSSLPQLLDLLAAGPAEPFAGSHQTTMDWNPGRLTTAESRTIVLGSFPVARAVIGPDPDRPGHSLVFVFAHEV